MILCEVVNANNTGKPCPNPGTETAELVYPSGVSETKRCCPEHAAMVEKASAAARSVLAARADARRAESDARAERLAALRTARAIRPVAELPPADPVPPVTPVTEIPTMPDPTSTTTPPKPARGKPAPKPERSSLGGVLACRACGKSASYPLCKADRERVRKLRLLKLLPADFDAKTSPISILDEAWAAFEARKAKPVEPDEDKGRDDAPLDAAIVNGETSDPEAPVIVPPKVGDRWGDLSPRQKAMVSDGSLLYFAEDRETCEKEHGSWPYEVMHDDNVVVRLGPAPTATPEPDRSGWPVLVRDGRMYAWPNDGSMAVWPTTDGGWHRSPDAINRTRYPTAKAAADSIHARLPDGVSEAARTVAPQPPPTNTEGDVWQELIDAEPPGRIRDLMVARREQGIAKYGRPLGRENGRDHTADAIQEALDGMVYATAAGRVQSMYAFRNALGFLTGGVDESAWVWRASSDAEIADLRAALEGQTLANAPLRDRVVAAELERDEAVRSIAALRADAEELRVLREALTTGKAGRKLAPASLDALAAADERLLRAAREQARPHDDRTVGVLRFATERILDSIATASKDGRPADLGLLEAVRVIATGKVPEGS